MALGDFKRSFAHGLSGEVDPNGGMAVDATRIYWGIRGAAYGLHIYELDGTYVTGVAFFNPGDVFANSFAVDDIYIYVLRDNKIQRYVKSPPYLYVDQFGTQGSGNGEWNFPGNIAVDGTQIYVADNNNNRIAIFNKNTFAWVTNITANGTANAGYNLAIDASFIYLANYADGKIEKFDISTYAYVNSITAGGPVSSIAVDDSYVYAGRNPNTEVFNKSTHALVDTIAWVGQFYGGTAALNGEVYISGLTAGPMKIYDGVPSAPPDTPTGFIATCQSDRAPSILGVTMNPKAGNVPLTVQFTPSVSGNTPLTYLWEFGDGTTSTSTSPSHQYTNAGTYQVRLTVTNSLGSDVLTKSVTVFEEAVVLPPIASFTSDTPTGNAPLSVNFTNDSTGTATAWEWYVDGVLQATTQNFNHTFSSDGVYIVKLIAKSEEWETFTTQSVFVSSDANLPPVAASMTATQTTTGDGTLTAIFSAAIEGSATSYLWDFGDGNSSNTANPTHTFSQAGIYTVSLTLSNIYGSTSSTLQVIVAQVSDIGIPGGDRIISGKKIGYYIVDSNNHRILVYQRDGVYITKFGSLGTSNGKFNFPTRLAVSGAVALLDRIELD